MGFKMVIHLFMMPELQLAREKDRDMGKGKKSFRNLNIERIVYFFMWATIIVSFFFSFSVNTFPVRALLGVESLVFVGLPLAEVVFTFSKTREGTKEFRITTERAVYFLAWTGLLFYHFFVVKIPVHIFIIAFLGAGLIYFIGLLVVNLVITLPKNIIIAIHEMKKGFVVKLAIFYSFLVFMLSFILFDEPKAYIMTGGLYIMGVTIFLVFLVVKFTLMQSAKLIEAGVELFHGEELPVRPEEFRGEPLKMSYIYQGFSILTALTLFGVWVRYTDYDGFRYVSPYSSYIITGGMISILLLWIIVRRIREEKGDLIKGL
ncbi:MAG: hypothetical protein HXS44_17750 [Theionarchaea archaeon]|nr:hypothetical protein [Theionarchaea archaeon]